MIFGTDFTYIVVDQVFLVYIAILIIVLIIWFLRKRNRTK